MTDGIAIPLDCLPPQGPLHGCTQVKMDSQRQRTPSPFPPAPRPCTAHRNNGPPSIHLRTHIHVQAHTTHA